MIRAARASTSAITAAGVPRRRARASGVPSEERSTAATTSGSGPLVGGDGRGQLVDEPRAARLRRLHLPTLEHLGELLEQILIRARS